jgi:hypothetical protein
MDARARVDAVLAGPLEPQEVAAATTAVLSDDEDVSAADLEQAWNQAARR